MHLLKLCAVLLGLGVFAAGCGWSPPSASPPPPDTCAPADGPSADTVATEIERLPRVNGQAWQETARGNTADCRLYWVQLTPVNPQQPDSPQQVVFFDRNSPIGTPTPEPRPYINVLTTGADTVTVQYQWRQGADEPCCPTGIGSVRFRIGEDGTLKALDPMPGG